MLDLAQLGTASHSLSSRTARHWPAAFERFVRYSACAWAVRAGCDSCLESATNVECCTLEIEAAEAPRPTSFSCLVIVITRQKRIGKPRGLPLYNKVQGEDDSGGTD